MQANKTLSRQRKSLSRQWIYATVRNSVATKEFSVATKVEKNHKRISQHSKECCNKVEELKEETSVATKDEEERIEDCCNKETYVATVFKTAENDKLCCNKVFMS